MYKFDHTKVVHIHSCPCHIIELSTMKDHTGKVWTYEEIEQHKIDLIPVEEPVETTE
jgi:hypothetical protein